MKFEINAEDLKYELDNVGIARSKRSNTEAMRGILFEISRGNLTLTACNIEYSISGTLELGLGYYDEDFSFVAGDEFISVIGKLPKGMCCIDVTGDTAKIVSGAFRCKLSVLSAGDFFVKEATGKCMGTQTIEADELNEMIRSVAYACAKEARERVRTGIKLSANSGKLKATALDGIRIAVAECEYNGEDIDVILSGEMLKNVKKLLSGEVTIEQYSGVYKIISDDEYVITVSQLEGEFPDFEKILPTGAGGRRRINTSRMVEALERLDVIAKSETKPLELRADKNIQLSVRGNTGQATETVEADILNQTESIRIGLNLRLVIEALKVLNEAECILEYSGKRNPISISNTDGSKRHIIFPVLLRED